MRFLTDENFPGAIVESLRREGHGVFWARVESPGVKDKILLSRAREEGRILLTFDKDFGELAFRSHPSTSGGIILFRITSLSAQEIHDRILTALHQKIEWIGHFAVVEDDRIRLTPLPKKWFAKGKNPEIPPTAHEAIAVYSAKKPRAKATHAKNKGLKAQRKKRK